jgi:hypothetical protein
MEFRSRGVVHGKMSNLPVSLVDLSFGRRIVKGVDDAGSNVREVDGTLDRLLALLPQGHHALFVAATKEVEKVAEKLKRQNVRCLAGRMVSLEEFVLRSVDVRGPDNGRIWKLVQHSLLSQPLCAKIFRTVFREDSLKTFIGLTFRVRQPAIDGTIKKSLIVLKVP